MKRLVIDCILAAITIILYAYVKFPLPIFPSFLEFNISMLPIIIALLMFGYKDALIISIFRIVGKLILGATTTMYIGELADLIMSLIIISGIYLVNRRKTNNFRMASSIIISWVFAGIITNIFINIPLYMRVMGITLEALVEMCSIIPGINQDNFMLLYIGVAVIPFNLMLSIIVTIITVLVNKRLKVIYEKYNKSM